MRATFFLFLIAVVVAVGAWWLKFEHRLPQATMASPVQVLGRRTPVDFEVSAGATGLRTVSVRLEAGGVSYELLRQDYPKVTWRGSGITAVRLHVEPDLSALKVAEGPAALQVLADTWSWHLWPQPPRQIASVPVTVDVTPPRLELLTTQHNVRLGGVELAVFRQSPDTVASGIQVDHYYFPATTGHFADGNVALAFFAIPQDLDIDAQPHVVARDAAGNEVEVDLPVRIKPRHFAERTLDISDAFVARVVPEMQRVNQLPATPDLVQGYVFINGELRKRNEEQIHEITAHSRPQPLWDGAFHRQSNAAPLSSFADRRTYTYKGAVIDHQTHLGYDLASLKRADVEAAQNGYVVHAGNLGIYGNAVIIDHGLGIFSLYGHLSSLAVKPGDFVKTAQTLGQTGETGLAGGDHLHFSVMLYGTHVDPVEWWDPHWLHDHVTPKLTMLPLAAPAAHPAAGG